MTKWYNGVEVLDIETLWTGDVKDTYPYAFLVEYTNGPCLFLLSTPIEKNATDSGLWYATNDGVFCYSFVIDGAWELGTQLQASAGSALMAFPLDPFWASWDMTFTDGVLYLAASEPSDTDPNAVFTVVHRIKSDLQQCGVRPRIDVMQGDTNTRILELTLLNGGTPWRPYTDTTVLVTYGRSNGTGGVYDTLHNGSPAGTIDGNVITVTLVPEMTALAGMVRAAVRLIRTSTGDVISTFSFDISVDADPAVNAANASGNYINWFGHVEAPLPETIAAVLSDAAITVTSTYADGSSVETVIELDGNGDPVSVSRAGTTCTITWEGFDG